VAQKKLKICERKRASRLKGRSGVEGFQTAVRLRGWVSGIYSIRDVQTFRAMITLQCGESEVVCSWFRHHAHRWLHSIHFACKADGKFFLITSIFFIDIVARRQAASRVKEFLPGCLVQSH
jgi:hypothetical protein